MTSQCVHTKCPNHQTSLLRVTTVLHSALKQKKHNGCNRKNLSNLLYSYAVQTIYPCISDIYLLSSHSNPPKRNKSLECSLKLHKTFEKLCLKKSRHFRK